MKCQKDKRCVKQPGNALPIFKRDKLCTGCDKTGKDKTGKDKTGKDKAVKTIPLSLALKAIDAEEELLGSMPDTLWIRMNGNRAVAERMLRLCVALTKENIKKRTQDFAKGSVR